MTMETNRLRGLIRYLIREAYEDSPSGADPDDETARVDRDRAMAKKRVFKYNDDETNSHKFWWIRANLTKAGIPDGTVTTGWGRIGSVGQTQTKVAPKGRVAFFMRQIIDSKLKKGYEEHNTMGAPLPLEGVQRVGEAYGPHGVNTEDYAAWRQQVSDELADIWPESSGLRGLRVPELSLKMRFKRGDDARTTALSIEEAERDEFESDQDPDAVNDPWQREAFVPRGPRLFNEYRQRKDDPPEYSCSDCGARFDEDDLKTAGGRYRDVCPECGSEDIIEKY